MKKLSQEKDKLENMGQRMFDLLKKNCGDKEDLSQFEKMFQDKKKRKIDDTYSSFIGESQTYLSCDDEDAVSIINVYIVVDCI